MGCTLQALGAEIRACKRCPDLVATRSQPVPGVGSDQADIMFVGEAPGRFGADRTGRPFEGDRSGALLQEAIKGLKQTNRGLRVFVTNAVKCNPRDIEGRNRGPTHSEIAECKSHLHAELEAVEPRVVVALGALATRILLGNSDYVWWKPVPGAPTIIPAIHPGFVIRGGGRQRLTRAEYLSRVKDLGALL